MFADGPRPTPREQDPSTDALVKRLEAVEREMRDYNDSDGERPCAKMDYTGGDPETDRCHRCGWPEHCHVIEHWYLSIQEALAALQATREQQ